MNKINNQLVCNGDKGARDGGQRIREERAALWREAGEGLSKKATLQNGLRAEPWERLRGGCSWQKKRRVQRSWGGSTWSLQSAPVRSERAECMRVGDELRGEGLEGCEGPFRSPRAGSGFGSE